MPSLQQQPLELDLRSKIRSASRQRSVFRVGYEADTPPIVTRVVQLMSDAACETIRECLDGIQAAYTRSSSRPGGSSARICRGVVSALASPSRSALPWPTILKVPARSSWLGQSSDWAAKSGSDARALALRDDVDATLQGIALRPRPQPVVLESADDDAVGDSELRCEALNVSGR